MEIKTKRVVITGMGVITPIGNSIDELWDSLMACKCGISKLEGYEDTGLSVKVAARVKDFDPANYGMNRADIRKNDLYSQFAQASAYQAMQQSGLVSGENIDPERLGVYLGSGIGGLDTFIKNTTVSIQEGPQYVSPLFVPSMIPNIAGGNIAIKYNAQGAAITCVAACATGTNAIGEAYLAIRFGRLDAVIAGGSEAAISPLTVGGFANAKALTTEEDPHKACLPFDARRAGFVLGEGSGVIILEEYEHAVARGANIIAEVCGYGVTCDAYHYTAPRPDGVPASRAMKDALAEAGYKQGENLYINAHGTGTKLNDSSETTAIKLALGEEDAHRASISSTKSMHGHMVGATGAVEIIISALALQHGVVPPTVGLEVPDPDCDLDYTPGKPKERNLDIALSNSLGFGGHNVCVVMRKS